MGEKGKRGDTGDKTVVHKNRVHGWSQRVGGRKGTTQNKLRRNVETSVVTSDLGNESLW